jgi:serine/threonine protein kinase
MHLVEGAEIAGRFRLERKLGEGGMGEVWTAIHMTLDVPCAVKFIHAEAASNIVARARFEREAKAAAKLRSAHVVQILDYGVCGEVPYIAMEYLEGEDLRERLRRQLRLSPRDTVRIVSEVGKALAKAHGAGIVHRDLKPENIFLVKDEDGEVAKVLDFGVAKQTQSLEAHTTTGALLGTPYYMSPEQAQGTKAVDHRSDLWSLAVLTYRCLTGELPFQSQALGDLLIKIVMGPMPVPSQVVADLPPAFDQWWKCAAQRDPDHRFQSAKELVSALRVALGITIPNTLGFGSSQALSPIAPAPLSITHDLSDGVPTGAAHPFGSSPGVPTGAALPYNQPPTGTVGGVSTTAEPAGGKLAIGLVAAGAGMLVAGATIAYVFVPHLFVSDGPGVGARSTATVEPPATASATTASATTASATTASASTTAAMPPPSATASTSRAPSTATPPPRRPPPPPRRPPPPQVPATATTRTSSSSSGYDPGF